MKLTGKCTCGTLIVLEDEPAVFGADNEPLSIERRFDAWLEEHRACRQPRPPAIHRLFQAKGPKVYEGSALKSTWGRMSGTEQAYAIVTAAVTVAAMLILAFR